MPAPILLNIGNTHIQVADVINGNPRLMARHETAAVIHTGAIPSMPPRTGVRALALCVVPQAREALERTYGNAIRFLTREDFPCLDFSRMDTSTLGMDRISNAACAHAITKAPVAVLDFGTCINSVVVDSGGVLLGGAICPGRMLLRQALAEHTAQLPLLPIQDAKPSFIGTNTRDAIFAGVDGGILGAVREIMDATRRELKAPSCTFLATGGDAAYFLKWLTDLRPAPDLMTLRGILCRGEVSK